MTDSFVSASAGEIGARLSALLREVDLPPLTEAQIAQFESYYTLLVRWNARINVTAIRDREGILSRHFVESIACACSLPAEIASLLDFGSGGGFQEFQLPSVVPTSGSRWRSRRSARPHFFRKLFAVWG